MLISHGKKNNSQKWERQSETHINKEITTLLILTSGRTAINLRLPVIEVQRREPCIGQNEEKNQQLEIDRADANRALSQHVFSSEKSQVNSQYFNHCQRMEYKRKEKENWAHLSSKWEQKCFYPEKTLKIRCATRQHFHSKRKE